MPRPQLAIWAPLCLIWVWATLITRLLNSLQLTSPVFGSMGCLPTDLRPLAENRLVEIVWNHCYDAQRFSSESSAWLLPSPTRLHIAGAYINGRARLGTTFPTNRGCILNWDSTWERCIRPTYSNQYFKELLSTLIVQRYENFLKLPNLFETFFAKGCNIHRTLIVYLIPTFKWHFGQTLQAMYIKSLSILITTLCKKLNHTDKVCSRNIGKSWHFMI